MKFKHWTRFYCHVYGQRYTIVLLDKAEVKQIMKEDGYSRFEAKYDPNGTMLIFNLTTPGTIAHECWHALESNLFIRRDVSINIENYNEHIAYYLDWLVNKTTKAIQKLKNETTHKTTSHIQNRE